MTDLVVVSLEAWDSVWRRNQHLVAGLLRRDAGLRALFVEPAPDPLHSLRQRARPRRGAGLRPSREIAGIRPGQLVLFEPTKYLPRRLDRDQDFRWAQQVRRAVDGVGMDEPILWVNDPRGAHLVTTTDWRSLYDITDDWTLADRNAPESSRVRVWDDLLLEKCEEIVVCSAGLVASKGAVRRVTLIPNGVDTAAYRKVHPRPDDLPIGPVALYVGTLHADRLDVQLVAAAARELGSRALLVLVGPDLLTRDERDIVETAGAVVLGTRSSDAVPAYLQHADVLIVPHLVTAFTDSLDPIKLYEYAAADRPVASTPVAGFRDVDDARVTVAEPADFPAIVLDLLTNASSPGRRRAPLSDVDWSDRVARMAAVIARLSR